MKKQFMLAMALVIVLTLCYGAARAYLAHEMIESGAVLNSFLVATRRLPKSIQRSTELPLSFFQLPDTKYAAHTGY
jgi:hypothetical protein